MPHTPITITTRQRNYREEHMHELKLKYFTKLNQRQYVDF